MHAPFHISKYTPLISYDDNEWMIHKSKPFSIAPSLHSFVRHWLVTFKCLLLTHN